MDVAILRDNETPEPVFFIYTVCVVDAPGVRLPQLIVDKEVVHALSLYTPKPAETETAPELDMFLVELRAAYVVALNRMATTTKAVVARVIFLFDSIIIVSITTLVSAYNNIEFVVLTKNM